MGVTGHGFQYTAVELDVSSGHLRVSERLAQRFTSGSAFQLGPKRAVVHDQLT